MCYSKEVQLATWSAMLLFSTYYYFLYSSFYSEDENNKWLIPFLNNSLIAFWLIWFHQIFEFLSLVTNSQLIYKSGLIISITAMYFLIRSLEKLVNRNFHSIISLVIVWVVAIQIIMHPGMYFQSYNFYLQHNSVFIWGSVYILLFVYFHICAIRWYKYIWNNNSRKIIITYFLSLVDTSFIFSLIYTAWWYYQYWMNMCSHMPSIWCTFQVIQALMLPFFLWLLPRIIKIQPKKSNQTILQTIIYYAISAFIVLIFFNLPFFKCITIKFPFP